MRHFTYILVYLLLNQKTLALSQSCEVAEKKFQSRFEKLEQDYKKISKEGFIKENKPYWKTNKTPQANGKIVYLLHGFIGSPFEMKPTANLLYDLGYTVVNDLIPGHGINGAIANHYDANHWVAHFNESINLMKTCSDHISLIGFSTGGLLIHDYLISHPDFKPESVV